MNSSALNLSESCETVYSPTLTVITTPSISRLTSIANETIKSDVLDVAPIIERYSAAIDEYMATIDRRDLVMGSWKGVKSEKKPPTQHISNEEDKARRVETSAFWDALEKMGQRLDYIIENNEREAEKQAAAARTRAEWEELEKDYVGYPPTVYEEGEQPIYCAAWDCHAAINPRGKRKSKYCSDACRNEQKAAKQRLKKSGTYLPVKVYERVRKSYAEAKAAIKEVSLNSIPLTMAMDGRDYRVPVKRDLSVWEMTEMEFRRGDREKHGETEYFNLDDTKYYIDAKGNYHIDNREWQTAKEIRRLFPWNNFI